MGEHTHRPGVQTEENIGVTFYTGGFKKTHASKRGIKDEMRFKCAHYKTHNSRNHIGPDTRNVLLSAVGKHRKLI